MKQLILLLSLLISTAVNASTIYEFDLTRSDGQPVAGTFTEIELLSLSDPDYTKGIDTLTCTIDITESLECSETLNLDSSNFALTLSFLEPLTSTSGSLIDLTRSSTENLTTKFNFTSGVVTVQAVPVPAAIWLFVSALAGLIYAGVRRR